MLELLSSYQTQQLSSPAVRATLEETLPDLVVVMDVLEQFDMNSHEEVTRLLHASELHNRSEVSYVETSSEDHAQAIP